MSQGPTREAFEEAVVPESLRKDYALVEERSGAGAEAQLFLLRQRGGALLRLLKVYGLGRAAGDEEAQMAVRCSAREHVVEVVNVGSWGGRYWELMEFCEHGSLANLLAGYPRGVTFDLATDIFWELFTALEEIHRRDIVHRDLKPSNVLVRQPPPNLDLVLADFGQVASLRGASRLARSGGTTVGYAAPEAALYDNFSPASDWWSVGVITLEMLLGRHPAGIAANEKRALRKMLVTETYDVSAVDDPGWQALCAGLLTLDERKRWGLAEVDAWLDPDQPDPKVHRSITGDDVPSAARRSRAGLPYVDPRTGEGATIVEPSELATAMAVDWPRAIDFMGDTELQERLRTYLRSHFTNTSAAAIEAIASVASGPVEQRLCSLLALLDPDGEPIFRGRALLDSDGLVACAFRDDEEAVDLASALFEARALMCYAEVVDASRPPSVRALSTIDHDWLATVRDATRRLHDIPTSIVTEARPRLVLAALLAAQHPGMSPNGRAAYAAGVAANPLLRKANASLAESCRRFHRLAVASGATIGPPPSFASLSWSSSLAPSDGIEQLADGYNEATGAVVADHVAGSQWLRNALMTVVIPSVTLPSEPAAPDNEFKVSGFALKTSWLPGGVVGAWVNGMNINNSDHVNQGCEAWLGVAIGLFVLAVLFDIRRGMDAKASYRKDMKEYRRTLGEATARQESGTALRQLMTELRPALPVGV